MYAGSHASLTGGRYRCLCFLLFLPFSSFYFSLSIISFLEHKMDHGNARMLDLTSQTEMMIESNDNSGLWFIYEPHSSFLQQVGYLFILTVP